MRHRHGLTLIELLVAASIGVLMITLVTGALVSIQRITERNRVLLNLHENLATINRRLSTDLEVTYSSSKWEVTAIPGPDGIWNSNDETLTLTWMTTLTDPRAVAFNFSRDARYDLTWCRLQWVGAGVGKPAKLLYTRNSGFWYRTYAKPGVSTVQIHMDPMPRRDRRRSLDDNDLRFMEGLQPAEYTAIGMPGDSGDLNTGLSPIHGPDVSVENVHFTWIDRGGMRIDVSANGIAQYDVAGVQVPLSGGAWDSQSRLGVDGVFLDARPNVVPGTTRLISDTRPSLFRLSCTLLERREAGDGIGAGDKADVKVDLSIPVGPDLSLP